MFSLKKDVLKEMGYVQKIRLLHCLRTLLTKNPCFNVKLLLLLVSSNTRHEIVQSSIDLGDKVVKLLLSLDLLCCGLRLLKHAIF